LGQSAPSRVQRTAEGYRSQIHETYNFDKVSGIISRVLRLEFSEYNVHISNWKEGGGLNPLVEATVNSKVENLCPVTSKNSASGLLKKLGEKCEIAKVQDFTMTLSEISTPFSWNLIRKFAEKII